MDNNNLSNFIMATILSLGIMLGWHFFYEKPRREANYKKQLEQQQVTKDNRTRLADSDDTLLENGVAADINLKDNRIKITSEAVEGSINLKGLRFDNLILKRYKETIQGSQSVSLLNPMNTRDAYFVELGWISNDTIEVPDSNTIWVSNNNELTPTSPVTLTWTNKDSVKFVIEITIDDNYLFTIKQRVENNSTNPIKVQSYGLINRNYNSKEKSVNILHQGPLGVIDDKLVENSYEHLKDNKNQKFARSKIEWLGITDKYWLVSFIPDKLLTYNANFNYVAKSNTDKYQVDFIAQGVELEAGGKYDITQRLFAGAKKVDLLDKYEREYNIGLFDRAIDFGWFYIITKPLFNILNFFYKYTNNFGISILIVTVIIKLLMFTLSTKSYRSLKKIKILQPEIDRIKSIYAHDKARMNQEIMLLYKKEQVNPVSGCLPLFIQIPVFFSLYKVLYVTIEMRHAPFFGWIHDLSAPDPTNIFNLFGFIPYTPPSFLSMGAWPIIMALTMFLQQRMTPPPSDPTQAQVMKFMPLFFLIMFNNFPAGLLIYWSWNNILSIIQQYYINKIN